MEEQGSIVLQKKMILTLFTIIFTTMSGIYVAGNNFRNFQNMAVAGENVVVASDINFYEDDIIRIEQIAYAAVTAISEGDVSGESTQILNEVEKSYEIQDDLLVARAEKLSESPVVSRKESREDTISKKAETESEKATEDVGKNESAKIQKENTTKYVSYRELAEDNPPAEYDSVIEVSATAYCLCKKCCGKSPSHPSYGMTASGYRIVPGSGAKVIAVDPSVIPLGAKVYVEGLNGAWDYGHATASDTGSAIKNKKIDLYMDTHSEALSWGRRKVKVYLISE